MFRAITCQEIRKFLRTGILCPGMRTCLETEPVCPEMGAQMSKIWDNMSRKSVIIIIIQISVLFQCLIKRSHPAKED